MTSKDMLSHGWSNYLSDLMGLGSNFWLAQGNLGLQTSDDSGLFLMADAVPPESDVNVYDASSMNKRSSAYLGLLCALLPETNPNALSQALGPQYAAWNSWKAANPITPGETYLDYFKRWGIQSDPDPGTLARGQQSIVTVQNTQLIKAFADYTNPAGRQSFGGDTLPKYTTTHQAAVNAIAGGGSMPKIDFDSSAMMNSLASDTGPMNLLDAGLGAAASVTGLMGFFYGEDGPLAEPARLGIRAENALTPLHAQASNQRVTITGSIGSYATLVSVPGSWYTSAEVGRAFNGRGNTAIWDAGAASGGWESFFDPKSGSLARYVTQFLLISNYQLEVTIYGQDTNADLNLVRSSATRGAWPLFSSAGPPTQNITYQRNSESSVGPITTVHQLDPGKIQIWGVTVRPAP
jgi:hypothetical protein